MKHSTLIRFGLVGVSNMLIGTSIIYACWRFLGFGDLPANVSGYAVGFVWSYALNRRWTFRHTGSRRQSFVRFLLVTLVAYACNLAVLFALRRWMGDASFMPHLGGMVVYTFVGYGGSRLFAFRPPRPAVAPLIIKTAPQRPHQQASRI